MNIVYLLGAGASFQSVPIYAQFTHRFSSFITQVSRLIKKNRSFNNDAISEIDSVLNRILLEISGRSPDLYAQKLYVRKTVESRIELAQLKMVLSLYLLFEQMPKDTKLYEGEFDITDDTWMDARYEYFLGSVLNFEDHRIKNNVKILSWNYDMQLEMAFCERTHYDFEDALDILGVYRSSNKYSHELPNLVKLNGTAGLYSSGSGITNLGQTYLLNPVTSKFNIDTLTLFYENLLETISKRRLTDRINSPSKAMHPHLFFAWEEIEHAARARKYAAEIMRNADVLVIIGYSFHQFNKQIDAQVLNAGQKLRKIYLQVSKGDFNAVSLRLRYVLKENTNIEIVNHEDLNQFHIPPELE
jgi:hypothetical protein